MSATLPWFSKRTVAAGAVVLAVGAVAACSSSSSSSTAASGSSSSTASSSTSAAASGGTITIGASLSLTGDFSADGLAFQKGYELWASDVNAAGGIDGKKVSLKVLDDKSDPNQVVTNYQTLINTDHVDLTFGPFSSLLTTPASAVAARAGYAFIEGAGGAPTVFDAPSNEADHNTFDVALPVADSLMPFVNYVASLSSATDHKLTAAFPAAQDPLAGPPVSLAESKLKALGVTTVYDKTFPEETASYGPAADQVAASKADIVVLGSADVPTVQAFMQEFAKDHYTPKLFIAAAGPDQGSAFTQAVGGGNALGMMVPDAWYPGFNNATSKKMVSEYTKLYGGNASGVNADVAEAYSVGQVAADAVQATGGTDNAKIISYLHSGVTLQTVEGAVKFDSLGENSSVAAFIFQWQGTAKDPQFVQVLPAGKSNGSVPILATKPNWTS